MLPFLQHELIKKSRRFDGIIFFSSKIVADNFSGLRRADFLHYYDRTPAPNWNYNLYTMIHAKTREECEKIINELSTLTGVTNFKILYTKKEWKKTGMKYFCE